MGIRSHIGSHISGIGIHTKEFIGSVLGLAIDGEDGLVFDTANLNASTIRAINVYGRFRLTTVALLDNTRIPITIDGVGIGLAEVGAELWA